MENRFDNKVLFVLRGEQVQGGSYCIMGFPALRARTKHGLASDSPGERVPVFHRPPPWSSPQKSRNE